MTDEVAADRLTKLMAKKNTIENKHSNAHLPDWFFGDHLLRKSADAETNDYFTRSFQKEEEVEQRETVSA